ncbi:MAG: SPOR domain-containing protein [Candidatus Binataceae bacterium]|nr:SPOR domain-containing protein [Candidatus Binataceae bacterium]
MRFEIKAGGALLFLVGLAALSGMVFALGLIAGYEMARQNQVDASQLVTNYPLPSPALVSSTPVPPPVNPSRPVDSGNAPAPIARAHAPMSPPRAANNNDEYPDEAGIPAPAAAGAGSGPLDKSEPGVLSAPAPAGNPASGSRIANALQPTPVPRRHPYNIQIDAVMDMQGAQQMAGRLRRLGYNASIFETNIAGQTWYRVRVGPYASQAEARAAQDRLRSQYNSAFSATH